MVQLMEQNKQKSENHVTYLRGEGLLSEVAHEGRCGRVVALSCGHQPEVLMLVVGLPGEAEGGEAAVQHHAAGLAADAGVGAGIPIGKSDINSICNCLCQHFLC